MYQGMGAADVAKFRVAADRLGAAMVARAGGNEAAVHQEEVQEQASYIEGSHSAYHFASSITLLDVESTPFP